MAKNEFLPFGTAANANVLPNADYQALPARTSGFGSGVAKSEELNSVWRQASTIASVVAQFIVDNTGNDVLDNGNTDLILASLKSAMGGRLINVQTFTASGTYSPTPGAKKIRITLTGGGGGGGGCQATSSSQTYFGAGGGAGATVISQFILTGAANYPFIIGTGGAGGVSAVKGSNGSATTFSSILSAPGGLGGTKEGATNTGGGYGGMATAGDIRINGGDGGDGQSGTTAVSGQGGASYFGGGGRAGAGGGIDGKAPGSGGGGAYDVGYSGSSMNGGKGASGLIIIEEYS